MTEDEVKDKLRTEVKTRVWVFIACVVAGGAMGFVFGAIVRGWFA